MMTMTITLIIVTSAEGRTFFHLSVHHSVC